MFLSNCIFGEDRNPSFYGSIFKQRQNISAIPQLSLTNVYVMEINGFYRINHEFHFSGDFFRMVAFRDLKLTNQSVAV